MLAGVYREQGSYEKDAHYDGSALDNYTAVRILLGVNAWRQW